jgi:hypothetical protein
VIEPLNLRTNAMKWLPLWTLSILMLLQFPVVANDTILIKVENNLEKSDKRLEGIESIFAIVEYTLNYSPGSRRVEFNTIPKPGDTAEVDTFFKRNSSELRIARVVMIIQYNEMHKWCQIRRTIGPKKVNQQYDDIVFKLGEFESQSCPRS